MRSGPLGMARFPWALPPRRWILLHPPSHLGPGSSSWVHLFKSSWTTHQRKVSLASCQDPSSTSACQRCWVPAIGIYHHGGPLSAPPPAGQSHRTPGIYQTPLPPSLGSSRQLAPCPKAVLVTGQVSRSSPASAGSQWLKLQLQNEHLASLFSQGLANQDFDRRFLDDSRVLWV